MLLLSTRRHKIKKSSRVFVVIQFSSFQAVLTYRTLKENVVSVRSVLMNSDVGTSGTSPFPYKVQGYYLGEHFVENPIRDD